MLTEYSTQGTEAEAYWFRRRVKRKDGEREERKYKKCVTIPQVYCA